MSEISSETQVRFLSDSRLGDWKKGDLAIIESTVATPPLNLNTLYILRKLDGGRVWATDKDVEKFEQLLLF